MAGALVWLSQETPPATDAPTGNPKSTVLGSPRLVSVSPASISALVHAEAGDNALPKDFYEALPASLSNAGSPAPLVRDANGSVSADSRLRRLFDFYLNAIGEEPLEHIVARIRHALGQQLSGAALEEALGVLENYLQYRNAVGEFLQQQELTVAGTTAQGLDSVLAARQSVIALRGEYFDPTVETAFFGQQDATDHYLLERVAIVRDPSLTDSEKTAALSELDRNSSEQVVGVYEKTRTVAALQRQVRDLQAQGAPQETIFALRESLVGAEAAQRLAALDRSKQEWMSRLAVYREELAVIESDPAYPPQERRRLTLELRERHFSGNELVRVEALDRNRAD